MLCWSCYPYAQGLGKENSLVGGDQHEEQSQEAGPSEKGGIVEHD